MRDGACVIRYDGKRGVVWRIKYRDAAGQQVQETLGRAADGWSERKAKTELRARLTDVQRDGLRRVDPTLFETFAQEWDATYPDEKALKRSTRAGYTMILTRHLIPFFGPVKLDAIDAALVERYMAAKREAGLAPRTINRHLNLLHKVLSRAQRRQLLRVNPVGLVDRPREPRRHWTILAPAEVVRVERAFAELVEQAETAPEREWREQARVVFLTLMGTGIRRGELLGLRWRNVHLADPDGASLRVAETVVRGKQDTPKSEKGERTIALGQRVAAELFEHRSRSAFQGDDEYVFCHPQTGGVLDDKRYARTLRLALAKAKIDRPMRPFHDGRHTSITNAAAAGTSPAALMARAGHSDFATTQLYIDLSGEAFREEAQRLEDRLWGGTGTKNRYKNGGLSPVEETETAAMQEGS
jgi:site-specific recombinase XerD